MARRPAAAPLAPCEHGGIGVIVTLLVSPLLFGAVVGTVFAIRRRWMSLVGTAVTTVLLFGIGFFMAGALTIRDPTADEVRWVVGDCVVALVPIGIGVVVDRRRTRRRS